MSATADRLGERGETAALARLSVHLRGIFAAVSSALYRAKLLQVFKS